MEDYGTLWWVLLAGGVGLVFGAGVTWIPVVLQGFDEQTRSNLGKDSVRLRKFLAQWEPFVLARRGTVREVKRFANRARFVMAIAGQESDEKMRAFVGFIALEQCEVFGDEVFGDETNEFNFEKWRKEQEQQEQREQKQQKGVLPEGWIAEVKAEQWEEYIGVVG